MKEKQSGSVLHLEVLFVLVYLSKNLVFLGEIRNNPLFLETNELNRLTRPTAKTGEWSPWFYRNLEKEKETLASSHEDAKNT